MSKIHQLDVDSVMIDFNGQSILTDIALSCRTGDIIGILGRNGSGKSTLLKIIFGTQPTFNKNIRIDGHNYPTTYTHKNMVAYLPQHDFLPVDLSLKSIINKFITNTQRCNLIKQHPRIEPHLKKSVKYLSGGERKFFEVMFLLNQDVKFVLLDEPFSGIEPKYKKAIGELLNNYRHEKGFIITDHDYQSILNTADRVLLLKEGHLLPITDWHQLEHHNYVPTGTFSQNLNKNANKQPNIFDVDKQTLKDIDIETDGYPGIIMKLFSSTKSQGTRNKIQHWIKHPVTDINSLKRRRDAIRYFKDKAISFDFPEKKIVFIEHYIHSGLSLMPDNSFDISLKYIQNKLKDTNDYYLMTEGIKAIINLLSYLSDFINNFQNEDTPHELSNIAFQITNISQNTTFKKHNKSLTAYQTARLHNYLYTMGKDILFTLIDIYYHLDALQVVANTAIKYNMNFADHLERDTPIIEAEGLFHPLISQPVPNNFTLNNQQHLCFLTGANMSGKSTFLKSFALSIYLAHIGFPVPAKNLRLTIFNGLMTTINLSDNIQKGYSHFYSEVKRVKKAAQKIMSRKKMVVIFDELFRGTNVKDAADASLMITSALANIPDTFFLVSTHIVEIAAHLNQFPGIRFNYFETIWKNETPYYNYKLKEGISDERLGLYIVKKEGILEVLKEK